MSNALGRTLKALPTVMRVGLAESVAYRAEMIIWVFSTTMPFVMLGLWSAVSEAAPVLSSSGRSWGSGRFVAYFLTMFVVRQLVSSWAAWEMNFEVRQGTLAMRLLRPLHPIISWGASNLAALPLRSIVTLPVVAGLLLSSGRAFLTGDLRLIALAFLSLFGGWLITFFANISIGALALFMESSTKVMDVWFACFFVFSGYMFPTDFIPPWLAKVAVWLPFRFQVGLPVELMLGQHDLSAALGLIATQWLWAGALATLAFTLWRTGVARFQAYGG